MNDKTILLSGGTGSFGQAATKYILTNFKPRKLIIFSRSEFSQFEMSRQFPDSVYPIRYFIGDIRDRNRLDKALKDVDYVVHTAALKQVPACEYNPQEAVKTNIYGTQNVIDACIGAKVKKVIFLSTDKACEPCNLYGMTKAVAERLIINANMYSHSQWPKTNFSVVRYGNVMGSRGSVIPYFKSLALEGKPIPITHPDMTRFWITLEQAVKFVLSCLDSMVAGEIFVPKLPSINIYDLAEAIAPGCNITMTGIRPGEKIHEKLISMNERNVEEKEDRFIIHPVYNIYTNDEINPMNVTNFTTIDYSSDKNPVRLSIEQLRKMI